MYKDIPAEIIYPEKKQKIQNSVPRKDDLLWKGILEDVFEDFLCFLIPDARARFDFTKGFTFLNKELEQLFPPEGDIYKPKVIDKLVKVYKADGNEEWILVHVEVQGQFTEDFGHRMFTYFYRIFDRYKKPITAYAILTESVYKNRDNFFELSYMGTQLRYTYNVYKIANQNDEELLANPNPFALVVLTAKIALSGKRIRSNIKRDNFLLELKIKLAKELFSRQIHKNKIRVLMNFLRYYVRFSDPENNLIFEHQLEKLTEKTNTMGIEELLLDRAKNEGKLEGKHEEAVKIAREMKKDKFPFETIAKLTKLSLQEIEVL